MLAPRSRRPRTPGGGEAPASRRADPFARHLAFLGGEGSLGSSRALELTGWVVVDEAQRDRYRALLEPVQEGVSAPRWFRFGEWGGVHGSRVAHRIVGGRHGTPNTQRTRLASAQALDGLAPEPFSGRPATLDGVDAGAWREREVARVTIVRLSFPGTGLAFVEGARVDGGPPVRSLFDTGVSIPSLHL